MSENRDSELFGMKSGDSGAMSIELNEVGVEANKPDKLTFPKDLENEQFYPEAIKFTIYQRYGKGLKEIETAFNK